MSSTMPEVGQLAPGFTAETEAGTAVSLADYRGKWVILYFYPKDNTPGCTKEACSLRDSQQQLLDLNALVLGVSADSPSSHRKFIEKYSLPFTLIADTDRAVCNLYGVYGEKTFMGKVGLGIKRTTFLIDPEGVIRKVFDKVSVGSHGEDISAAISELMAK